MVLFVQLYAKHFFSRYRKNRIDLSAEIDILGQHKIMDTDESN